MADILIVENNEHISRMFQEVLARENHKVALALDGQTALELIDKKHFEIAFIDLGLPDMCGLEVIKSLKLKSPLTLSTVISGKNDINYAVESIKAGIFRYLKKPFDIDDIKEITALALEERRRMIQTGYTPGQPFTVVDRNQPDGMLKFFIDLPLVVLALLVGFVIQQEVYRLLEIPMIWGVSEIVLLALSFACCFGFMHFRKRDAALNSENKILFRGDFMNLTSVYLIFTVILFFTTNFIDSRLVLISGFCLGIGGLWLSRFMLTPVISRLLLRRYEGPRRIVLKGFNKPLAEKPVSRRPEYGPGKTHPEHANRPEYEVSGLIRKFRDNRSKIDLALDRRETEKIVQ